MNERAKPRALIRLRDSDLRVSDPKEDYRGYDILDRHGALIGTIENLYVDEAERKVRFLGVGAGGFLGLGKKHLLIPAEAVTGIDANGVKVDRSREHVAGSPEYDPDIEPEPELQRNIYGYYGHPEV